MKYRIILFLVLLSLTIPVFSKENAIHFNTSADKTFYKTDFNEEGFFFNNTNLIPGEVYTNELTIYNDTKNLFTIYLKFFNREQSTAANDLIDHLNIKIYNNDSIIYDGKATGVTYDGTNYDLEGAITLGDYQPNSKGIIKFEVVLDPNYGNIESNEFSYVDWKFYGQYDDNKKIEEITENPNTGENKFIIMMFFAVPILLLVIMIGMLY